MKFFVKVMNYIESAKLSIRNLKTNKIRSLLTMLGVIIGVMSIILLVSIVAGTRAKIEDEIKSIGSNAFMVVPGNLEETHGPPGTYSINKLKLRHINLIESLSSYNAKAIPAFIIMGATVKYKRESRDRSMLIGTTHNFPYVRNWNVRKGKFFNNKDITLSRKVVIVGESIVRDMYAGSNPIGKDITVFGKKFLVIGILESKGRAFGRDIDDMIVMPITTAHKLFGSSTINWIGVKVSDAKNVHKAGLETKRILEKEMDKEDFSVRTQQELLGMFNTLANVLSVVMGCVASISLIVGGIGIMNIMLVTVKERTREIGIRKAVGATFYDILYQFIIEAVVVAISGGVVGIMLAVTILSLAAPYAPLPLKADILSVIVAFLFSALTGIFFGTYPAAKAAKIDPILALRYE